MSKSSQKKPVIELEPDAWPRFERYIKDVAKAGPQHRKVTGKVAPPKRRRADKGGTTKKPKRAKPG